jgi:cbb3-type cytochrome oxidase maturation protein
MTFLDIWIIYAVVGTTVFSLFFFWAVRARQFTDLDRGRFIPLESAEIVEGDVSRKKPLWVDRLAWPALFLILAGLTVMVLRVAARGN